MNSKIDNPEKIFRTVLAIVCLVIGTLISFASVFISFVPLILGLLIALTGLILFLVDALFS